MSDAPSVIISGSGPTGLTLAAELATAGIRCRVMEKRKERVRWSRAFGLMPRTMELLDMRGQVEPFLEAGLPCSHAPLGDLHGHLDYNRLDTPFPYILILPQCDTEDMLEEWALRAGAEILRETEVVDVRQEDGSVLVDLAGKDGRWQERADFVVGCDGVRSTVRERVGIAFPGRTYDESAVIVDAPLRRPPNPEVYAKIGRRGMVAVYPFGDGNFRLIILDRERMGIPVEQPVTLSEARESCEAILGSDLEPYSPLWMSRFRSSQRHATRYRQGRIVLAGDAAHTHIPSGGQGLQVGMQDAMNLAWKLVAELRGWAPADLLDSYERERLPVAAATLRKTDLAFRFETSNSAPARLARWLIMKGGRIKPLQVPVMEEFAGFTLRYPLPGSTSGHPLVGSRLPDATVHGGGQRSRRAYELFRDQRFVLLDQSEDGVLNDDLTSQYDDRVLVARGRTAGRTGLPEATLVRPDGYVAWAGRSGDTAGLHGALSRWCGAPTPARPGAPTG